MAWMICDRAGQCCPCDCPAATPHDCGKHGGGEVYKCMLVLAKVRCVPAKAKDA
jgi:hypothetical protein